jgi:hypothetical protein
MRIVDPEGGETPVFNRSKQDMVIMNRYKEADLKKMKVTQLRRMVHQAGIHGVKVAGASKEKLIIAIMMGVFPEDDTAAIAKYEKFAAAFAPVIELIADMVAERLKERPKPISTHSRK